MSISDGLGIIGVIMLAISVYMAMGLAPTVAFIGMTMLILAVVMARHEAKSNGNTE